MTPAAFIRGGRVIDPASGIDGDFDVLISGGEIEALEPAGALAASASGTALIDASGCWVVPGLIDPHVHLRDPGFPEKETIASGLRAAAAGGFTAVAAMANTNPVNDIPATTRYMLERAGQARAARLIAVSAVTRGLAGLECVDFAAMAEAGVRMFSDDGMPVDDQVVLRSAMERIARLDFAISLHEEDRGLSCHGAVDAGEIARRLAVSGYSAAAEAQRIRRDLALAIGLGAPIHIAHVSTRESLDLIRAARRSGARVTCEVTPHHFALDSGAVLRWGPNAKMNPPLRSREDVAAIGAAIADGTIDMIASDHAPHDPASKHLDALAGYFAPDRDAHALPAEVAREFGAAANGIVGLETSLGLALELVHRSLIGAARLVEMMSLNPAALLRLDAGTLAPGGAADITVIDPNLEWSVEPARFRSMSRNTPFAGRRLRGRAILTIVAGEVVFDARRTER
ncbi:MAG TPA: dihydroorotase [Candidatus Binataceae bacterium]|nr:dihydroorotase [Candidatus Binataceae bacterium]